MSQEGDFENDIWEYQSLRKRKKRGESLSASATTSKRSCVSGKTSEGGTAFPVKSAHRKDATAANGACFALVDTSVDGHGITDTQNSSKSFPDNDTFHTDSDAEGSPGNFCPMCQMPFSILVVQSQRWHVAECLDTPRDSCEECPEGLQCSSTYPNHYKKFNHTLLAVSRAESDSTFLSESQQTGIRRDTCLRSVSETSQDSFTTSPHSSQSGTPRSKLTNGLQLLRSPGPEDFKKKKGWSSSTKARKSVSASQESKTQLSSTPVKSEGGGQSFEPKHPDSGDSICYSPLSEFPAESELGKSECRKALFNVDAPENKNEDSMELFSESFSSDDELLAEFIDKLETYNVKEKGNASLNTQLESVTSAPPTNQPAASLVVENGAGATGAKEAQGRSTSSIKSSIQSPQSIVLERLRETLQSSESLPLKSLYDSKQPHLSSPQVPSSPSSIVEKSQTMAPQKGASKTSQASCLRQTDIGVFFGLKPLKEKETKTEIGPNQVNATSVSTPVENPRKPRKKRQREGRADAATDTSQGNVEKNEEDVKGEAGKGRSRGWRGRRWNRTNADGEAELPHCPFYKKIPGTKFVVDAFRYGAIKGISTYFLTHFHSDHYGGLTKNSTFPIYCNRITGNLVKSKLKVEEHYVHILPMNTQVTVEEVTVVLLDANHCPGAAMLLFFLPDGQTILHTGDFRADPSMETYPELLSCRVQTLYLDTTYCSPEYTFPRQQEVIRFAASSAFELVTLNPRTLVVCGSYSVGKEKVFLALAEVLGSKVCLSRDKYNTMCCLESEQVRKHITTDWKAARVHVLPMMQLSFKKLQDHLARFSGQYDQLVAFKPTGWTFSQQVDSVDDIQPQISGNISIYGIPYSEHSSFLEMKRFVQWLKPLKIIPTVNNGNWASRKAMEKCFSEWLTEAKVKQ